MKFKPLFLTILMGAALLAGPAAQAQLTDDADWKESEVPPPPAFDTSKLVTFDVGGSELVYGVDPATMQITGSDSLLRYVVVATSKSGARNILYEAIRCKTGEVKTYARYTSDGKWSAIKDPQWQSMFDNMPSKHALRFARAGACDSAAPTQTVGEIVSRLRNPNARLSN